MTKGTIVRATEPRDGVVVTKLYEVQGRSGLYVRVKGLRSYHPMRIFRVVEPDELEAIEAKVHEMQSGMVAKARQVGNYHNTITPETVLGMVLIGLLREELDGKVSEAGGEEGTDEGVSDSITESTGNAAETGVGGADETAEA